MSDTKKAVVLVSGGLDSATVVAIAASQGYQIIAVSFDYGQRHISELEASKRVAEHPSVIEHKTISIDLAQLGGSALTDDIDVPEEMGEGIPVTYVPARNTVFLSYALAVAEVSQAQAIFVGVNAVDYSGYPDCRPEYIEAFETMANLATKAGVEGHPLKIHTPLINLTKAEIIKQGIALDVDYAQTVSCYQADEQGRACGVCDSCRLRKKGFEEARSPDPTKYK
jgi:7-cyano-7-deazaguanine synthase